MKLGNTIARESTCMTFRLYVFCERDYLQKESIASFFLMKILKYTSIIVELYVLVFNKHFQ